MYTIFLGAGYSKWAVDLPLGSELFDFRVQAWPRESRRLERVRNLKRSWDEANPNGLAEQFIAEALTMLDDDRRDVIWYVARRLSEPFIARVGSGRRTYAIHDRLIDPGADLLRSVITGGCAGIVTTNYDLLVEYTLTQKGFHYGIPGELLEGRAGVRPGAWLHPVRLTGSLPLAKLHGSLSWGRQARYVDGRRGITGDALIVAPTPDKRAPAELEDVWELARGILGRSESVLVFGFAFNPYDEAVLDLLREAGEGVHRVLLVDPRPNVEGAAKAWPEAEISSVAPPPEGGAAIAKWLGLAPWMLRGEYRRTSGT